MSDLTGFLLARIAEDEERADHTHLFDCVLDHIDGLLGGCSCVIPARVLAECEAKRRIVELSINWEKVRPRDERTIGSMNALRAALLLLALPYADHPGFREEWRP